MKWWIISVIIGLIAYPISYALFRKSYDRGYMFTKTIGIFILAYFSWLFGFFKFGTGTIITVLILMAALSGWLIKKNGREMLQFLGEKPGLIMITELFYLLVFLVYAFFRMHQPDIIGTEKFMDFAFMNAITRAESMPPFDPWMIGQGLYISYYYFGYVMMAIMTKLTGVPNSSAFNLALTYIVSLSAISMVGLLYNLTKNFLIGFLAAAFLLLISNIDGFIQFVQNGWSTQNFNWWHSSRIIDVKDYDVTINEFPFFSFLLGDMHPHQMAIPFVLLALNTALSFIKKGEEKLFELNAEKLSFLGFSGLLLGGLWFLNSWDFPTYFFITALCVLAAKYGSDQKPREWAKDAGIGLGIILAVAIIMYLPFTVFFKTQASGIGYSKANTRVADYLVIFGIMLFPIVSLLIARFLNWLYALKLQGVAGVKAKKRELYCPRCAFEIREGKKICGRCGYQISGDELYLGGFEVPVKKTNQTALAFFKFFLNPVANKDNRVILISAGVLAAAIALVVIKTLLDPGHFGLFSGIMLIMLGFAVLLAFTRTGLKENQFVFILIAVAFLAALGCEFFHIKDTFGRPGGHTALERMNTVFKFYYQKWIFFSVAAAYGFFWVSHFYLNFKPKYVRYIWKGIFTLLIIMGMFYPFAASSVKTGGFRGYYTLDGMDFLKTLSYHGRISAAGDYQAILWLRQNIKGAPVILEAWGGQYTEFARIASFTGIPTVIGWPGHELQWRGSGDEAGRRQADVDTIYETTDIELAKELMAKYNVEYVYVGALERDKHAKSPEGLDKFNEFMDIAYQNRLETKIYRIRR